MTFIDETYVLDPGDELTFGREADLVVDDANPYLHRLLGTFVHHDGSWWLRNDGRNIELTVVTDRGTRIALAPRSSQTLTGGGGVVRFQAGALRYELTYEQATPAGPAIPDRPDPSVTASRTREFGALRLNVEQRQMLVALAEPWLRDPTAPRFELPANAEIAGRLGWSLRKFDRKLDYLCRRLDELGVRGVRGRAGEQAAERRRVVVDHVLTHGLVTADDLALLGEC